MNYQKELDKILLALDKEQRDPPPRLLLHSCCAPCSTYVLEYLATYFEITLFYYNPNIYPEKEYDKRILEQQILLDNMNVKIPITFIAGHYDREKFYEVIAGFEDNQEGGKRCHHCYRLRLEEAARVAKRGRFDYFTTTLTISPMKSADKINEIGTEVGMQLGIPHLPSDFKKRNGYKRSIELSKQYELYRQDYCGCEFSIRDISK